MSGQGVRFLRKVFLGLFVLVAQLFFAPSAYAEVAEADGRTEDTFSFLRLFAGDHDFDDERWNIYGQSTYISSWKQRFNASYTNLNGSGNSLLANSGQSYTHTITAYLGLKLWEGGEFYFTPEMIGERPFSGLHGLGGTIQNFELQKNGSESPTYYRARAYLKQTFSLGGNPEKLDSNPMQLGSIVASRRLVITAGNLSVIDIFDKNSFSGDLRQQFFNMAFLTYAAYDFAADARGYSWGSAAEYFFDDWSFRLGRFLPPKDPNQLPLTSSIFRYYGDQAEIEHRHTVFGESGAVRFLAYRNLERMGKWTDAMNLYDQDPTKNAAACQSFNYDSKNKTAPDLCWVRKPNVKSGVGINIEQSISEQAGVFLRVMHSDGRTEVYSYTSTDRSVSAGILLSGGLWGRSGDSFGAGIAEGWISREHARFLKKGGVDAFVGDGNLNYHPEQVFDIFYKFNIWNSIWLSLDFQHIFSPGFNMDRGPVNIAGFRAHVEF